MKRIMRTSALLGVFGNTHSILVFSQTTVRMEIKPLMEVTFVKGKLHVNKFSWLKVSGVNCCALVDGRHFCCEADFIWCLVYFLKTIFW